MGSLYCTIYSSLKLFGTVEFFVCHLFVRIHTAQPKSMGLLRNLKNQSSSNVTVQGKSKLMEGGTKLGFPLDCHKSFQNWLKCANNVWAIHN